VNAKTGSTGNSKISATSATEVDRASLEAWTTLRLFARWMERASRGFECGRVCKSLDRRGSGTFPALMRPLAVMKERPALPNFVQIEFPRNQRHDNKKIRIAQLFTTLEDVQTYLDCCDVQVKANFANVFWGNSLSGRLVEEHSRGQP
jgi:hypothetical protein